MFELFKSEIKRLKLWIVVPILIYLSLNVASIYVGEYKDSGLMIGNVHSVIFAISSLLLGLFQFSSYKKLNRWIYLINRPISLKNLCSVLLSTGGLIVLIQYVIPDLLLTITMDNFSIYLIESRHYRQSLYVLLISMSFYLSGVYIQLAPSKSAWLVLGLPVIAITSLMKSGPVIFISIIVMVWLLLMVLSVFKANTNSYQNSVVAKILAIFPYQMSLYFILLSVLAFAFQLRLMLIDGAGIDVPWNKYFADDVYKHIVYLEGNEQLALNLKNAEDDYQKKYMTQMKTIKTFDSSPQIKYFNSKSILPYQQNIRSLNIMDPINQSDWVFSMDNMSFIDTVNGSEERILTNINHETIRFRTVPYVIHNEYGAQVITQDRMYTYDSDFQKLALRFNLEKNESFLSGFNHSNSTTNLITTHNLYVFDSNKIKSSTNLLMPLFKVELPGAHENLKYINVSEMMDKMLIGFLFGKLSHQGHFTAQQILIEVDSSSKQIKTVATRPLKNGLGEMYYQMNWYISPLTHWFYEYFINPNIEADPIEPISVVPELMLSKKVIIVMIALILLSVLSLLWVARKRDVKKPELFLWIVLTSFTSITGLLTFIFLTDKITTIKKS